MHMPEKMQGSPQPAARQNSSPDAAASVKVATADSKNGAEARTSLADTFRAVDRYTWLVGLALFVMPLVYALYTGEVWEDFFITFRFSHNLAQGNGLVFQPGERVYGFTSAINTLVPAFFDWLSGARGYEFPLWAYRIVSAAAFAAAGMILTTLLRRESGPGDAAPWIFALLLAFDLKAVAFSANGQEAAFMLLFLAMGFVALFRGPVENWRLLGVSGGGLLLTRPDGCVYAAILAVAGLLFGTAPARKQLPALAKAAALCAVIYLPWFLTAWSYFGTPVPHTVVAKSVSRPGSPTDVTLVRQVLAGAIEAASLTPAPVYASASDWPLWANVLCLGTGLVGLGYWLVPSADRLGRMASFIYLLGCLYISLYAATSYNGAPFPWYLPAVNFFALVVLARAPATLLAKWEQARSVPALDRLVGAGLVAGMAGIFLLGCRQIQVHQREIEWGVRARVGRWLADHVAPSETVYSESLGYFGYFGQCHMLDWPGLVTPRVVETRRRGNNNFIAALMALQPDYAVLRPNEKAVAMQYPEIGLYYDEVETVRTAHGLSAYASMYGVGYLKNDETFAIMKRNPKPRPVRPGANTPSPSPGVRSSTGQ
jgi:hypothetical protein